MAGAQVQGKSGIAIAEYVFGFPWATGWCMVATVFGEWRSVPGGQIAPVPVFSVVVDAPMIFLAGGSGSGRLRKS